MNKLDVGRQSRILNTTQDWVVSKLLFAPLLIRRVHGDNVTMDTKLVEDKDKTGTGEVLRLGQQTKIKTKTASNISHGPSGCSFVFIFDQFCVHCNINTKNYWK